MPADTPGVAPGKTRSIVLTGASSGLGAALARLYAAPGVRLGLVGRNAPRLAAVVADVSAKGAEPVPAAIDVRDGPALAEWLLRFDDGGATDLVVAAAGISAGPQAGEALEPAGLAQRQVAVNLLGCMNTVEPLLPRMVARGRGQVAVVSSVAGLRGLPYSPGYSASKAGVRAYGDALRALLGPRGIRVSVVVPGFFDTPMTDRFHGDKPFLLTLDRAAALTRRGVDAGRARVVFPRRLALALRAADLAPPFITDRILRAVRFHIVPPADG